MKAFTMSLLEVGSQASRHAFLHLRLIYDVAFYRLWLGFEMANAQVTSFKIWGVQITL